MGAAAAPALCALQGGRKEAAAAPAVCALHICTPNHASNKSDPCSRGRSSEPVFTSANGCRQGRSRRNEWDGRPKGFVRKVMISI